MFGKGKVRSWHQNFSNGKYCKHIAVKQGFRVQKTVKKEKPGSEPQG
jgi:hypothetical protein